MKLELKQMILIALFAALMVVGAKLSIPTPFGIPLTFQLFFAIYAGLLLSSKSAMISQLIYILIGLIGIPVFAYGGGISYVFNPTFGYIIGFVFTAGTIAYLMRDIGKISFMKLLSIALIGYVITYLIGNIYFYLVKNIYLLAPISITKVFIVMLPYMVKDSILLVIAAYSATIIIPVLRKTGYVK